MAKPVEICNHCGRKVHFGSGWFAGRVPDCNPLEVRIADGRPYPEGDFVCAECDSKNGDGEYANDWDGNNAGMILEHLLFVAHQVLHDRRPSNGDLLGSTGGRS